MALTANQLEQIKHRVSALHVYGTPVPEELEDFKDKLILPELNGAQYGCDPELFISSDDGVVGSEHVIPECGLMVNRGNYGSGEHEHGAIARDGVQVELHPTPYHCRAYLSNALTSLFQALELQLKNTGKRANFSQVIQLTDEELNRLSENARQLGCLPSFNAYGRDSMKVDGGVVKTRSAAGHIHFGHPSLKDGGIEPKKLVMICDVLLGNTGVLLDRNPDAAERRKLYGKAGEHRLPEHGVEYRTLSNFWLRSYPLMSLVFGLAHQALGIAGTQVAKEMDAASLYIVDFLNMGPFDSRRKSTGTNSPRHMWNADEVLMKDVDLDRIEQAINTNDFDLALRNYREWVAPFFAQVWHRKGLSYDRLEHFDRFVQQIRTQGIEKLFPEDPMTHWANKGDGHNKGWEAYCARVIAREIYVEAGGSEKDIPEYGERPTDDRTYNPRISTLDKRIHVINNTFGTGGTVQ